MYTYTTITYTSIYICLYMYLTMRYACTKKYSLNNKESCFIGSSKPIKAQKVTRQTNIQIQTIEAHMQYD